jgi:hypothetical protein
MGSNRTLAGKGMGVDVAVCVGVVADVGLAAGMAVAVGEGVGVAVGVAVGAAVGIGAQVVTGADVAEGITVIQGCGVNSANWPDMEVEGEIVSDGDKAQAGTEEITSTVSVTIRITLRALGEAWALLFPHRSPTPAPFTT